MQVAGRTRCIARKRFNTFFSSAAAERLKGTAHLSIFTREKHSTVEISANVPEARERERDDFMLAGASGTGVRISLRRVTSHINPAPTTHPERADDEMRCTCTYVEALSERNDPLRSAGI